MADLLADDSSAREATVPLKFPAIRFTNVVVADPAPIAPRLESDNRERFGHIDHIDVAVERDLARILAHGATCPCSCAFDDAPTQWRVHVAAAVLTRELGCEGGRHE